MSRTRLPSCRLQVSARFSPMPFLSPLEIWGDGLRSEVTLVTKGRRVQWVV